MTTAAATAQLAVTVRLPLAKSLTTLFWMGSVPPLPRMSSITPWNPKRPASVTTNDGNPMRVISVPWKAPISAQTTSAAMHATYHGQPP